MNKLQLLYQLFCHRHLKTIINSVQLVELQIIRGKEKLYTVIWGKVNSTSQLSTVLEPSDTYTICYKLTCRFSGIKFLQRGR